MNTSFPTGAEAEELPLEALALRLLAHIASKQQGAHQRPLYVHREVLENHVGNADMFRYQRAMQEAWDWLRTNGLLSLADPKQQGSDFAFVTRMGAAALEDGGLARIAAQRRLGVDMHPLIAGRVRQQFVLGEYELAAIAALREVEIRVRELAGASESDIGVRLMGEAFKPSSVLHDPSLDKGESEAIMALFRGAIGVFKNPSSHRQVEFDDPTEASEVILLADLLLRMLDRIEQRKSSA
jgi:uncharacterized protein (TIGR02391 family)